MADTSEDTATALAEQLHQIAEVERQWTDDELRALLELAEGDGWKQMEPDRFYLTSPNWGVRRYHVVSFEYNGVVFDQTDHDEKYQQRVTVDHTQLPAMIHVLLAQHIKWRKEDKRREEEAAAIVTAASTEDPLSDLDDHPF